MKLTGRRIALAVGALSVVIAVAVALSAGDRLLMRDADATLRWLADSSGAQPSDLLVSRVDAVSTANRAAAGNALSGGWRVLDTVEDSLHDAVWVVVQISPDLGSVAGQVTSLRYRKTGWFRYELVPDASELLTAPPSSDEQ